MEKVSVTKEVLEAVSNWLAMYQGNGKTAFEKFVTSDFRGKWTGTFKPLNDLSDEDLLKVLVGWYTIIEDYIGKWVLYNDYYCKVKAIPKDNNSVHLTRAGFLHLRVEKERLAENVQEVVDDWKTPFLEAGRPVPEFKIGDIVFTENCIIIINDEEKVKQAEKRGSLGEIIAVYPSSSKITFK